jgi:hypothetical protein
MPHKRFSARVGALLLGLLAVTAGSAMAQLQTGNLYGKVSDQGGAALPGVTVTLDTGEAPQVQVTNAQGEFRFLGLAPATYKIKAELQGFSPVDYPRIVINVGRNTNIEVTMSSAIEDVITVTSESPLLDEKAIRTGATVSQIELQKIPTSRDPEKTGRNAGPSRPQETTWNQGQFGGKPTLLKAEDTQIFSPNLYPTVLYSHVYDGFFLDPASGIGPSVPAAFFDDSATWHNSFADAQIKRPQHQEKADASTFFNTGSLSHELKYGASYRVATSVTSSNWQGGGYIESPAVARDNPFVGPGSPCGPTATVCNEVYLSRGSFPGERMNYKSAYVQDTLTTGNLTVNLGLRYDRQSGDILSEKVAANPIVPSLLPAVSYGGQPSGFAWKTWSPRLGLTYALGKDRATLLRASYSRFADQLGAAQQAGFLNAIGPVQYYYAYTTNPGNGHLTASQIIPAGLGYSYTVNCRTPGTPGYHPDQLVVSNSVNHSLNAPLTDELLVSAEHALLPEFVVGLNLTFRQQHNLLQQDLLVYDSTTDPNSIGRVSTRADFVPVTVPVQFPNGSTGSVTYYKLAPGISTHLGNYLHNGDYQNQYKGASVTLNKRLSNRWMFRGNFTVSDWKWTKAGDRPDPTRLLAGGPTDTNFVSQGDAVIQASGVGSGSFANVYINSKWSFNFSGLYQVAPDRP